MPILIIYLSGTPLTLPLASGATVINPAVMMNKPPDRLVMKQFPFFSPARWRIKMSLFLSLWEIFYLCCCAAATSYFFSRPDDSSALRLH